MPLKPFSRMGRSATRKAVNALLVAFYLISVALWFKDSISFLEAVPLSPSVGVIPFLLLAVLRLVLRERREKRRLFRIDRRDAATLILILSVATLVRIPYLTHSIGLMDSDEAVPALMGKHIAEGVRPALFYYGQFYLGSLPQHGYALLFGLFGYSIFLVKLSAFLVYLAFICVHFVLLKKIFSFLPAAAMSTFFVLPLPDLVIAGFNLGSGFPFVFLFGSLILLLTHAVVFEGDDRPIPLLGFLMGLAFWTHQISAVVIMTSALFLAPAMNLRWKKYGVLAFSFVVGAFPVVLNEMNRAFVLVRFLLPGGEGRADVLPLGRYKDLVLSLIVFEGGPVSWVVLFLLLAGSAGLVVLSLRNKNLLPSCLFVVFAVVFSIVYLLSDFGRTGILRYMYVLYPALPVLLGGIFLPLGKKAAAPALTGFFVLLFFIGNGEHSRGFLSKVKNEHGLLVRTVTAMEETGERYWMGEYWTSYLLTALSGERLIVASSTIRRYFPYKLLYDSGDGSNWVIKRDIPSAEAQASDLTNLLDSLGVPYRFLEVGPMALFYRIGGYIYPRFSFADPQKIRPNILLEKTRASDGLLELLFVKRNEIPSGGYRIHIEIPGYFSRFFPLPNEERFSFSVPYPDQEEFSVRYHLAYAGLDIPDTVRETGCILAEDDLGRFRGAVVFLAGVGPRRDSEGLKLYALRQQASFEVQNEGGPASRLIFHLHSPFQFDSPFWYGNFRQDASISINGVSLPDATLHDGDNILRFDMNQPPFRPGRNRIDFNFRYATTVSYNDLWKTSAFLENIILE
jgi:hypothetical protein